MSTHGNRRRRIVVTFGVLIVATVAASIASAGLGQNGIPLSQVAGSMLHHLNIPLGPLPTSDGEDTLWNIRMPRVVMALIVGAALAGAGALLQGVFANPLAEPGVIGVSSGAAAGASAVIVFGGLGVANYAIASGAFVAGLLTTAAVYALSRSRGRTEVVTMVLTGIALNAFAGGVIAFLTFRADPSRRDQIVFWQLGSLNRATWDQVWLVLPLVIVGLVAAFLLARHVDLLSLGEYTAGHMGINVERVRRFSVVIVALLAAAAVAFCGIILFVGLVIPHLMRLILGPAHRILIPASVLAGSLLMVTTDLVARTAVAYADLPLGMITSLIGGPVFLLLLRRERTRLGGWE